MSHLCKLRPSGLDYRGRVTCHSCPNARRAGSASRQRRPFPVALTEWVHRSMWPAAIAETMVTASQHAEATSPPQIYQCDHEHVGEGGSQRHTRAQTISGTPINVRSKTSNKLFFRLLKRILGSEIWTYICFFYREKMFWLRMTKASFNVFVSSNMWRHLQRYI